MTITTPLNQPTITYGMYVDMLSDDANKHYDTRFVQEIDEQNKTCTFLSFISRRQSKKVPFHKVRPTRVFQTTARKTKGVTLPSLLSTKRFAQPPLPPQKNNLSNSIIRKYLQKSVIKSNANINPLYIFLLDHHKHRKGWLRDLESPPPHPNKLRNDEKIKITMMKQCLNGVKFPYCNMLANAWGVTTRTIERTVNSVLKRKDMTISPRQNDQGHTLFNCDKKRRQFFTAYNNFKKTQLAKKELLLPDIKKKWDRMTIDEKKTYIQEADAQLCRAANLHNEIATALQATSGSITWQKLEQHLQGQSVVPIISADTIRRHVMNLKGSSYTTNCFLPALNSAQIIKRFHWTKSFWVFWNSAKKIYKNVRVMLVHSDEKWFYAMVV